MYATILLSVALTVSASPMLEDWPWRHTGIYKPKSLHKWSNDTSPQSSQQWSTKPLVFAEGLAAIIDPKDLMDGIVQLQFFANQSPQGDRAFGGPAHMDTVNYLYDEINVLGCYDVYLQKNLHLWSRTTASLSVNGTKYVTLGGTNSPNGEAKSSLIKVTGLGCSAADFPLEVLGSIALIQRGDCPLSDKVSLAGTAGALGVAVYNNMPGPVDGPLGNITNPMDTHLRSTTHYIDTAEGYVPTVFLSQEDGEVLAKNSPMGLSAELSINEVRENRTTFNVIAQTKGGDRDNVIVLGAHSDSTNGAAGINDNGSGTIGLLAVAKALPNFSVKNAVRFCWWTAEEYGLLGSTYYVQHLGEQELAKVAMYLNFDMIASPNHVFSVYDANDLTSALNGSAEIEALFEKYYDDRGFHHVPQKVSDNADYLAFLEAGIPIGGLYTGSYQNKTEQETAMFGGTAGTAHDACYHKQCDDIENVALDVLEVNAKAIAYSVGTYARSLETFPRNRTS